MRINYLIKVTPLFSILLLIFFLNISNQNENTKLRLLIWNTPSLTLGTYLSLSTGAGFILSYLITTNLGKINNTKPKGSIKYKEENKYVECNEYQTTTNTPIYDKTLIERNIKDPSPTINASFRIIGRSQSSNTDFRINDIDNDQYDGSVGSKEKYKEEPVKNQTFNQLDSIPNDWNDDKYTSW